MFRLLLESGTGYPLALMPTLIALKSVVHFTTTLTQSIPSSPSIPSLVNVQKNARESNDISLTIPDDLHHGVDQGEMHDMQTTTDDEIILHKLKMDILLYIRKINYDIGYYWWKAYVYSAFWNNISTPINLVITILTALTTGHSATGSIISSNKNTAIGLATLIISIFNTFFRPAQQLDHSKKNMAKWYKLGIDFEKVYYSKIQDLTQPELIKKVDNLQKIFNDVNELKRSQETNFFIDIIFQNFISDFMELIEIVITNSFEEIEIINL
jgi:hypothetical protein